MTKTYTVTAGRWERGWELNIDGVGITQCTTLAVAARVARDYLATELGGESNDYSVTVTHDLGGMEAEIPAAQQRMAEAQQAVERAADEIRQLAKRLRADGISVRDAANILGISPGRVSQLAAPNPQTPRGRKTATLGQDGSGIRRGTASNPGHFLVTGAGQRIPLSDARDDGGDVRRSARVTASKLKRKAPDGETSQRDSGRQSESKSEPRASA